MPTKANQSFAYKPIPGYLKKLREDAGLTQRELGGRLGKTHSYIYKSETGERRVDIGEWIDWCRACQVDPKASIEALMKLR